MQNVCKIYFINYYTIINISLRVSTCILDTFRVCFSYSRTHKCIKAAVRWSLFKERELYAYEIILYRYVIMHIWIDIVALACSTRTDP